MSFPVRPHPLPRIENGLMLGTRQALGALTNRHVKQVSEVCQPVACDLRTRLPLYDLVACDTVLASIPRRGVRRVA